MNFGASLQAVSAGLGLFGSFHNNTDDVFKMLQNLYELLSSLTERKLPGGFKSVLKNPPEIKANPFM